MVTPSNEEVLQQLSRILDTPLFVSSHRLSRFLRYIVERTCAGGGDQLKEFLIGTEVYDRDARFDPRLDSVVRVEAGRLRSRLMEYYTLHGVQDAVIIRVPKGGYVPTFEFRAVPAPSTPETRGARARTPLRVTLSIAALLLVATIAAGSLLYGLTPTRSTTDVSVVVIPFPLTAGGETQENLAAITGDLSRELARLGTLQVVSHAGVVEALGRGVRFEEIAATFRADVIVQLSTERTGDDVKLEATLIDVGTQRKFWVSDFTGSIADLRRVPSRLAASTQAAVARNARASYWRDRT